LDSNAANIPVSVKRGGAITTDGTDLYVLQGDGKTGFWRYNVAANTWTQLAATPQNVKWGGALTRVGGYIYTFRGDGKTDFWRYDIAANTWSSMFPAPGNVGDGGALTTNGSNYIYAFQGKTKAFWRYDITANAWTILPAVNFPNNVGQGGALAYDAGVTTEGQFTVLTTNAGLVTDGDNITVTLEINSTSPKSNVTVPTELTVVGTNSASATRVSGPTLKSLDNNITGIDDPVIYEWVYTAGAGTNPGSVKFSVKPDSFESGTLATSRSVLVSPELAFQVQVFDADNLPDNVTQIENVSMISDQAALGFGVDSNAVINPLLRPKLVLTKVNDPQGEVRPGDEITYTLLVSNEGLGTATTVEIQDYMPGDTTYYVATAVPKSPG
jgi:uncharacterized repeat protein (TIGR01451 family)